MFINHDFLFILGFDVNLNSLDLYKIQEYYVCEVQFKIDDDDADVDILRREYANVDSLGKNK